MPADGRILGIPREMVDAMQALVQELPGEEVCGLLGGQNGTAQVLIPVENELHRGDAYRMEPQALVNGLFLLEKQGLDLLAICHSHPTGPAFPSTRDVVEFAYPGVLTLIWSPNEESWRLDAFWIEGNGFLEVGWKLV